MKGDIILGVLFLSWNFPGGVNPGFFLSNTDDITNVAIDFRSIPNNLVNFHTSQIGKSFLRIMAYTHFRAK